MWLFAAGAVGALVIDRRQHGKNLPMMIGITALIIIIGTLYGFYHDAILATGYVLLLITAFLNQNRSLAFLNGQIQAQAIALSNINNSLEQRVDEQVTEIEKLARLKRFLPGEVANLVTDEDKESLLKSHRRYIACLFCDIRRFTSMTESMEPEDVIDVLRSFHEEVGKLTEKYQGTIGYRAGDGVMVFFNDPIPCDDPDLRAIKLALELRTSFAALCEDWRKLGADVGLGVGVASGYATMGVIGVEGRFDYTPIGNAVNLAARLSDRAKDSEILISRRCHGEVEDAVKTTTAGEISLKGIAQPVEVFLLDGLRQTTP